MKRKYDMPSLSFPYKIANRLTLLSHPRKHYIEKIEDMPALSPTGVRKSALRGHVNDRVNDAAYPYIRRLMILKRTYKKMFSAERLQRLDRTIEACNGTMYSKLANCTINLKLAENLKDVRKKKGWNDTEWKKHTDYLSSISKPKPEFKPEPIERGENKPLEDLLPRIEKLCEVPSTKLYKRISQDDWYRDPVKVSPMALKYVISDRVKKLSEPKKIPEGA